MGDEGRFSHHDGIVASLMHRVSGVSLVTIHHFAVRVAELPDVRDAGGSVWSNVEAPVGSSRPALSLLGPSVCWQGDDRHREVEHP